MFIEGWQINKENQIPRQLLHDIMEKSDEQHRSGEPNRV